MSLTADPQPSPRAPRRSLAIDAYLGKRRQHREPILGRFVGHLRILLPLGALGVLLAGLIWPLVYDSATGFRLNSAQVTNARDAYSTMDHPRFAGVDGHEQPYVVTADRAVQRKRDDKTFDLTQPRGDIVNQGGDWIFAQSESGRLFQETRQLDMAGNVVVYHDKGNRLEGLRARVDLVTGNIASDRAVRGVGPGGTVDADGLHVSRNGRLIVFTGRTHMVIEGEERTPATAQTENGKGGG